MLLRTAVKIVRKSLLENVTHPKIHNTCNKLKRLQCTAIVGPVGIHTPNKHPHHRNQQHHCKYPPNLAFLTTIASHFHQKQHFCNPSNSRPSTNNATNNPNDNSGDTSSNTNNTSNENKNKKDNNTQPTRHGIEIDKLSPYPAVNIPIEERPDWVLIGVEDCQNVFRLNDQDLRDIVLVRKYDAYDDTQETHWYYLRDAWERSCEKYGQEVVQNWYRMFTHDVQDRVSFESVSGWQSKNRPKQPSSPLWNWLKKQISTAQSIRNEEESKKLLKLRPLNVDGLRVVQRAAMANVLKTIVMFSFYFYTQSYTLYSEALHASADSINQFLLLGAVYSAARDPDWTHPYGYGARRWIVSSLSGGVLAGMGLMSIYAGVTEMWHPHIPEHLYAGVVTCLLSFCLELYSFIPALREVGFYVIFDEKKNNKEHKNLFYVQG